MDRNTRDQSFRDNPEFESIYQDLLWIRDSAANLEWLNEKRDFVCRTIARALSIDVLYYDAVVTITELMPTALDHGDCEVWFACIADAVAAQGFPEPTPFQAGFQAVIADFSSLVGIYGLLDTLFEAEIVALLHAYIKLFEVLGWDHGSIIPHNLIDQAENVARQVQDKRLFAKLHQTLALYRVHRGEFFLAQRHAKLAYSEYEYLGDPIGSADAAATLAIALRNDGRFKECDEYLKRAIKVAEEQGYGRRYATLLYEEGVRCYRTDSFELGRAFLRDALEIFEENGTPYQIAMTHQVMAMIDIHTGRYDEATAEIAFVREIWQKLGNDYELANLAFVEADRELQRGNKEEGLGLLAAAREKALALPETDSRETMISLIDHHHSKFSKRL